MSSCEFKMIFTSDTNIFVHNMAVQWILLMFPKLAVLIKAFTRVDSSFSCPGIAEQHSSSFTTFHLFCCILHIFCHYFFHRSTWSVGVDCRCSASLDVYGLPVWPWFFFFLLLNIAIQCLDQLQDVFLVCESIWCWKRHICCTAGSCLHTELSWFQYGIGMPNERRKSENMSSHILNSLAVHCLALKQGWGEWERDKIWYQASGIQHRNFVSSWHM